MRYQKIDIYLEADASNAGWGASLNGINISGRWSEAESSLHINSLGKLAIKFALMSL